MGMLLTCYKVAIEGLSLGSVCFNGLPSVVQDQTYHAFADQRTMFGLHNFWNVVSNLPFFLVAVFGLREFHLKEGFTEKWERVAFGVLLAAIAAVGAGSIYYHLSPDDTHLFWDRLPMTLVFMTVMACIISDRLSKQTDCLLWLLLVGFGGASVLYWRFCGSLLPYGCVQFGAMILIPALLLLPGRCGDTSAMWGLAGFYLLAKVLEIYDPLIGHYLSTGGHPWKHLSAAVAAWFFVQGAYRRSADSSKV